VELFASTHAGVFDLQVAMANHDGLHSGSRVSRRRRRSSSLSL
jgi:hypothetical protein